MVKLAYLSDIFAHLNSLNKNLQKENISIFQVEDKIEATLKKLKLWHFQVLNKNYKAFPNLETFFNSTDNDKKLNESEASLITQHLLDLQSSFREYFPILSRKNLWIRNPFEFNIYEIEDLTAIEQEMLIEISTNYSLKLKFKEQSIGEFWVSLQDEFPELSKKATIFLMPFVTTLLCEKSFSALVYIKNKYRNRLKELEPELRIQVATIEPNIPKLVSKMQHQTSH